MCRDLERMKSLKENVNWKSKKERIAFLSQFDSFIESQQVKPNPRDIFRAEEIECLLTDCVNYHGSILKGHETLRFIKYVRNSGYKDQPETSEDDNRRTTPLHHAGRCQPLHNGKIIVESLFQIYDRYHMNYTDEYGLTHAHVAIQYGYDTIAKMCVGRLEASNHIERTIGNSLLHMALLHGRKSLISFLLRNGADPTIANADGYTPLHIISQRYRPCNANMLFKDSRKVYQPVQVDPRDKLGNTPLHVALKCDNQQMVVFLLKRGADPNVANNKGVTPLHVACRKNFHTELRTLLEVSDEMDKKVDVNIRDDLGLTPLQLVVANCMPRGIDLLMDRGADLSNFVFPPESYINETFKNNMQLRLASGALSVIKSLYNRGYELERSNVLTIMKLFANCGMFVKSENLEKYVYNNENFISQATTIKINAKLSLNDLIWLSPKIAEKQLEYIDYYELTTNGKFLDLAKKTACDLYLCEKLSKGFFRRWALDPFMELTGNRLPTEVCELILENAANEELCNICLAVADQSSVTKLFDKVKDKEEEVSEPPRKRRK